VHKTAALEIINENFRPFQKPLEYEQSSLVEWFPEGSYLTTYNDDNGANLQDVYDQKTDAPQLDGKYRKQLNQ
jgi:hypothetical protein